MRFLSRLSLALALFAAPLAQASTLPTTGVGTGANNTACTEATTFLARTSGLTAKYTLSYTEFICAMVSTGLWAKMDAIWLLATKDATTAGLNLKSTSFTLTAVNSPTFTADAGYAGNGSTSYLNTNFNTSTDAVQFTQNSGSLVVWPLTTGSGSSFDIGNFAAGLVNGNTFSIGSTDAGANINATNAVVTATVISPTQSFIVSRTASNLTTLYQNGVSVGTASTASQAPVSVQVFIGGSNLAGTLFVPTTRQESMASIGAGLTAAEALTYFALTKQYLHGVGAI